MDVNTTVTYNLGASPTRVRNHVEEMIRNYVSSLDIGEDVVYHRIVNSSLQVEGVYDVNELELAAIRLDAEPVTSVRENIQIRPDEMALSRDVNILLKERERRGG